MNDEDRLERLLRAAMPPVPEALPSRDLWPAVVSRCSAGVTWSWLDLALAALVVVALVLFPDWLWLLAYHL